jgi:outer membrane protein assembly factor BamA
VALAHDNSLFGFTSPFYGTRWRLEAAPSFGGWKFTQLTADYRRYFMITFPVSFAFRGFFLGRTGRDGDQFPMYMGWPDYVRGYTYPSYSSTECSPASANSSSGCPELDQLIGSRMAVFNAEFRFPLVRTLTLGFLPVGFPPIEAAVFYDAGLSWKGSSTLHASRPDSANLLTDRWPMTSYGVGIRVNLFGFTILRVDYAVPLQRRYADSTRNKKGYWIVSLGPPF